jgi:hypothetical protein
MLRRKNKLWVHHGRAQAPLSRAVETIREERVRSLSQARLHYSKQRHGETSPSTTANAVMIHSGGSSIGTKTDAT